MSLLWNRYGVQQKELAALCPQDCDMRRGDVQCSYVLPQSDGYLNCRYVAGHEGRHHTCYNTDYSQPNEWKAVTPREVTNKRLLWHLFWLLAAIGFVIGFGWDWLTKIGW